MMSDVIVVAPAATPPTAPAIVKPSDHPAVKGAKRTPPIMATPDPIPVPPAAVLAMPVLKEIASM